MIVGMMPPKLTQMMINIAIDQGQSSQRFLKNKKFEEENFFRKEFTKHVNDRERKFSDNEIRSF